MQPVLAISAARRVIIVEDSDAVRESLVLLLRTRGFVVEAYRSGMELLSQRSLSAPDCYVIDFVLPKLDGLVLLERLGLRGARAPAILITGFMTPDLPGRAYRAGFRTVVEKPPLGLSLVREVEASMAG